MSQTQLNTAAVEHFGRHGLTADTHRVALICALLWVDCCRGKLLKMMASCGLKTGAGDDFADNDIAAAMTQLREGHLIVTDPTNPEVFRLADSLRVPLYRELLATHPGETLPQLIRQMDPSLLTNLGTSRSWGLKISRPMTIAYVRASFLAGSSNTELFDLRRLVSCSFDWQAIVDPAIHEGFDGPSFERIEPLWRSQLALQAVRSTCLYWSRDFDPLADWAFDFLGRQPGQLSVDLRAALGDLALQRGDATLVERAVGRLDGGLVAGVRAAQSVIEGQWAAGQAAFEAALKQRRREIGSGRQLLPESYAWLYPLCLLAQQTPAHLALARKFCLGESASRQAQPDTPWGRWVHAIDVRLGNAALSASAFNAASVKDRAAREPLWTLLLAAWLGDDVISRRGGGPLLAEWRETIARLRQRLSECRLQALLRLLDGAEAVLAGRQPASNFFVAGRGQRWQEILLALQAVVGNQPAADFSGDTARLLWSLSIRDDGGLCAITPLEQKRGPRGWSRPQGISLGRLLDNGRMPLDDARILRAIRTVPGSTSRHYLDLAAAIVELVGHPRVVISTSPEEIVDLSETPPELALIRQGEHFVMRIEPPLRASIQSAIEYGQASPEDRREAEALRLITLVRDAPQRLRLVRFTAAQRHAAQLIAGELSVPASTGAAQLEKTVRLLSAHFQIHADSAQAARQVDSDSRLHAELSPVGESLRLRLIVTPLGANGPRLPPGGGRRQVMAVLGDETVGSERDFSAERHHLGAVLDALPFLDEADADGGWLIEDPEQALDVVETLPTLPAVAAVDWPQGKRLRVVRLDPRRLRVRVSRAGDWFRLSGQATVDEGLVLTLETLLGAAAASSRFVPIGDGVYAALTRALKQKLNDLAAVLESDRHGSKVPLIAAAWLDALLADTETAATADFRRAIEGLRLAQASEPLLPSLLQASLRPYQEDGYRWAIRLATAGIGGCLADDMGLGKTLQALAVLLQRAAGGPALVIAPTSVCGNWLAEAQRFAPSLGTRIYGEARDGEREAVLANAGPHDLLIVSYMLLQLAPERFTGRTWHTLIADEAQAIKNAASRRSQAVFGLTADFRLALTGTPVENRLADLWSIMRFANPGLLGNSKRFKQRFAAPIERNGDRVAQHILRRLIAPFVLRRTKSEVLQELPPRTELVLAISPDGAEAAHYEALRRLATQEIAQTRDGADPTDLRFTILTQLTRLRRAACDPRLTSPQFGIAGAKVQAFAELASELTANGHKALVFSQFVDFLSLLREPLDAAGVRYQYLDGATPAAERSRRVAAFQAGDGDLFLISLKAGGFGLNLTAADYVVITDPWWNPAAEDQAMGRAHRIGQLRPVTVYRLVSKGTVEERIVDLHHEKRALAESILAPGDASVLPSTEDLLALMHGE